MVNLRLDLQRDIEKVGETLECLPSWALGEDERRELEARLQKIKSDLIELSGQSLIIGILGGTGVGKSTLMNALAGEEISRASHRRPYTDRIILYHHSNTPIPEGFPPGDVPFTVFSHNADAAEKIIICDMPDFDSIREEHRARVLSFLSKLDILIWVTSPEKYADHAFYDFLKEVLHQKNPDNYFFVLNKVDLIASAGYRPIEAALKTFEQHLRKNGIDRPIIFVLSALEALEAKEFSPWNQWELFRREVFRERELKEIREIKKANIHQELSHLLEKIEVSRRQVEQVVQALDELIGLVDVLCAESREKCSKAVRRWLYLCVAPRVRGATEKNPDLIGPGKLIHEAASFLRRRPEAEVSEKCDEEVAESLLPLFRRIENRMAAVAASRNLPSSLMSDFENLWGEKKLTETFVKLIGSWREAIVGEEPVKTGSFLFRCYQRVIYWGILALFVASVGEVWHVHDHELTRQIVAVVLNFCSKMFSLDGLGGILVFIIFELMAGGYFFFRYRKSLQRRVERFIETLGEGAEEICDEFFRALRAGMEDKKQELLSEVKEI